MLSTQQNQNLKKLRIEPSKGWVSLNLGELWENRELLYFFVWRDLKVRYRQTILGVIWAILQPLLQMVIFSVVFGGLAKLSSDGLPYPIFNFTGLLAWNFFANAMLNGANSLVTNANMLKKIYFPRMTMPIATIMSGIVDFLLSFLVLIGLMVYYHTPTTINVLWLPLLLLLAVITSLGVGLWLAALNVQFRDVRYMVPFLTQAWFFATPITYSSNLLHEPWKTIYGINPMAGVVEGFRWALLGTDTAPGPMIIVSSLVAVVFLVSGAIYFRRMERDFADVV